MEWERTGMGPALRFLSRSAARTTAIGCALGKTLHGGECIALIGELGAGKTCFTQGIACGMGVSENYSVTSPTFTLINEYPGLCGRLIHMDVYRLTGAADLADLGLDEYLRSGDVVAIEWGEKIQEALPGETIAIHCAYVSENERSIEIDCSRERSALLASFLAGGG